MKILSIYYTHKRGGFCKRLYRMMGALVEYGHEVHYITLDPPPLELSRAVKVHQPWFPTKKRSGLFFWALFITFSPWIALFYAAKIKPDRYAVFGAFYSAILLPARFIAGGKIVLFLRSLVFEIDRITNKPKIIRAISNLVDRIGIRSADSVVMMTEAMAFAVKQFIGRDIKEQHILRNDISKVNSQDSATRNLSSPPFTAFASGVLDKRKNIPFLLEVFSKLQEEGLGDRLLLEVAGDGVEKISLDQEIARRNLSNVKLLGWQEDLRMYLTKASLFLHPALHEGVSNSLLEALAYGVPVLSASIPEAKEVLGDPQMLFSLENTKDLYERLKRFISDQSFRQELAACSIAAAERLDFDWDNLVVEIIASRQ